MEDKKEKLPKEQNISLLMVLKDIRDALRSDQPVDSFIKRWVESNPGVENAYDIAREAYAISLDEVISMLNTDIELIKKARKLNGISMTISIVSFLIAVTTLILRLIF